MFSLCSPSESDLQIGVASTLNLLICSLVGKWPTTLVKQLWSFGLEPIIHFNNCFECGRICCRYIRQWNSTPSTRMNHLLPPLSLDVFVRNVTFGLVFKTNVEYGAHHKSCE
ncbi:uncharacterized protein LOC126715327 isoform X1 [Quercus robur]|uniref:uncharacterized protein LOC126715327 isoform X1 n=1 Tax=Quercus robur TaxID=38942 RepID=UPI0021631943|nr:uncharacterized protein LOC126715327 isoform X1 [Quercus robur]